MKKQLNVNLIPIENLILHFNMQKHIEGGYASLFYEDQGIIRKSSLPAEFDSERPYFSGIYYLVPAGIKTLFHKLPINEVWHFCLGDPLKIIELLPEGKIKETVLGPDFQADQKFVHIVTKGNWFGSMSLGSYTLVTCTTAPGFKNQDFTMGNRDILISQFPQAKETIIEFTLPP